MPKIEFIPVKTGKFIPPKHDIYAEIVITSYSIHYTKLYDGFNWYEFNFRHKNS